MNKINLSLIKKHEGLASKSPDKIVLCNELDITNDINVYAYICAGGKRTIGWGCVNKKNENKDGTSIANCEILLGQRVKEFIDKINTLNIKFNDNEFNAVLSFVYNLGFSAFKQSTLLKRIKEYKQGKNNTEEVKKQWMRWVYASGKKLNGLEKRRQEECELFCTQIKKNAGIKTSDSKTDKIKVLVINFVKDLIKIIREQK